MKWHPAKIKNTVARHVISRIHAIRIAENEYVQGATVVEAFNWASDKMDSLPISDKEYHTLYKFRSYLDRFASRTKLCKHISYTNVDGVYKFVLNIPESCIGTIWNKWRKLV